MKSTEEKYVIWSNENLDYDRDWKEDLERDFPNASESERVQLMYEINDEYLESDRATLDVELENPIIIIGQLGLWCGSAIGYKELKSRNLSDCFQFEQDDVYATWYIDNLGDLKCRGVHHDGTNTYLYRMIKPNTTDEQFANFMKKILTRKVTRKDITRYTSSIGKIVADTYGFKI